MKDQDMNRLIMYINIILLTFLLPHNAFAECVLSFNGLGSNQYIVLDAENISSHVVTQVVSFTVENSSSSECYYFIAMDEGGAGDISYNLNMDNGHCGDNFLTGI